jgi:hypothetical protein
LFTWWFFVFCAACRYLLHTLGIAKSVQMCFSNRLLLRLYKAAATVEALLGVAFKWETRLTVARATIQQAFQPTDLWFTRVCQPQQTGKAAVQGRDCCAV